MRRGRIGGNQDRPLQEDSTWRPKPSLHNQSPPNPTYHENLQFPHPKSHHRPRSKWLSRNRCVHDANTKFIKKPEAGFGSEVNEQKQDEGSGNELTDLNEEMVVPSDLTHDVDDVGSRLETLVVGVEEPELSEDQLRTNAQSQEDEVILRI